MIEALQEAAQAVASSGPVVQQLTVQAAAAALIPAVVQGLKALVPMLEGRGLFWANMALNILTAVAMTGLGAPPVQALGVGIAGGLAGSKAVDLTKARSVIVSDRHRR